MPRIHTDHEWERRKGEDEFFYKSDAALIDKMRRRAALEEERRLLAKASGIDDPEILDQLQKLGFNGETAVLLRLVPLVQVAWSNGSVTHPERELVLQAAHTREVKEGTPAYQQLVAWLDERPAEGFFESCLQIIRRILQTLPPADRKASADDLIQRCNQIASVSRSLHGLGPRVSAGERRVLDHIVEELGSDMPEAA